ncbi:MAG: acyltransferase [Myxococcota bacterium]|jgi:surface polysaccharide O-acyltransferase-like enzyme|nr:acyltransferase [Myxococcota bacterium]
MTERYAEIDWIKVAGIFAVLVIHTLRAPWNASASETEQFLNQQLRFAVPGFLFCSGFLYARTAAFDWRVTGARLRRILVPYLVASLGAEVYRAVESSPRTAGEVAFNLLTGNSFGHYYYVFIIVVLVASTPVIARFGRTGVHAIIAVTMTFQFISTILDALGAGFALRFESNYWIFRSPLLWWNFFAFGWLVREHHQAFRSWVAERRRGLAAGLLVIFVLLGAAWVAFSSPIVRGLGAWLQIFCILSLILALSAGRTTRSVIAARISDATYAVYLFHLFFLFPVEPYFPHVKGEFDPLVIVFRIVPALIGSFLFIALARKVLGERSRLWLGA